MQKVQPYVRVFLTFLAAGLGVVVATVDDETTRIVGMAIISGLAAVGIVPPHIPTTTSIPDTEEVNVLRQEGQVSEGLIAALALVAIAVILAIALL